MIFMYYFVLYFDLEEFKKSKPEENRVHVYTIYYIMTRRCTIIAAFRLYGNKFGTISFLTELKAPHREHRETSRKQI